MSAKTRINRAEKAIKPKEQIEIVWVENMTIDGEAIPYTPKPGEKIVDLTHIWKNDQGGPDQKSAQIRSINITLP